MTPDELKVVIDGRPKPIDPYLHNSLQSEILKLKAELAQLAEENTRLREAIEPMKPFLLEIQTHEFNRKYPGKTMYGFNGQNLTFDQMNDLLDASQTPPTPGIGAALLKVVEAAKSYTGAEGYQNIKAALKEVEDSVQALNELEAKKGERDVEV